MAVRHVRMICAVFIFLRSTKSDFCKLYISICEQSYMEAGSGQGLYRLDLPETEISILKLNNNSQIKH